MSTPDTPVLPGQPGTFPTLSWEPMGFMLCFTEQVVSV